MSIKWISKQKTEKKSGLLIGILCAIAALAILAIFVIFRRTDTDAEASAAQTELVFVYAHQNQQWDQAVAESISRFEATRPDIRVIRNVQYEARVYDEALSKLHARNELGDLVQLKTPSTYAEAGALGEIPESVASLVNARYERDGKVYGVNALATTVGMVYNRDIFTRYDLTEPKTYDEFLELCAILKTHGETPLLFAGADLWHLEYLLNHFFQANVISKDENWEVSDGSDDIWLTDPDIRSVFLDAQKIFTLNAVNKDWQVTEDGSTAYLMTQGKAAMLYTGSWTAREIMEIDPEMAFGWFYLPDSNGRVIVTDTKDAFFCLTAECEADPAKYEAATAFLTFFYSEENYPYVLDALYGISVTDTPTDPAGDTLWETILSGYETNPRVEKYIGDEDMPEGFEREMLQQTISLFANEETLDQELTSLNDLWKLGKQGETR